jgi:hypothetical protein
MAIMAIITNLVIKISSFLIVISNKKIIPYIRINTQALLKLSSILQ